MRKKTYKVHFSETRTVRETNIRTVLIEGTSQKDVIQIFNKNKEKALRISPLPSLNAEGIPEGSTCTVSRKIVGVSRQGLSFV